MSTLPWYLTPILLMLTAAACWLLLLLFLSWAGGWARLGRYYPAHAALHGRSIRYVSVTIGVVSYPRRLIVRTSRTGLALSVPKWFRPFHPDVFVPWSAVAFARFERRLLRDRVVLEVEGLQKSLVFYDSEARCVHDAFLSQVVSPADLPDPGPGLTDPELQNTPA